MVYRAINVPLVIVSMIPKTVEVAASSGPRRIEKLQAVSSSGVAEVASEKLRQVANVAKLWALDWLASEARTGDTGAKPNVMVGAKVFKGCPSRKTKPECPKFTLEFLA